MIIKRVINKEEWDEFVCNHPHGNIFQIPEMYEVYQNTKKYEPVFLAVVNGKGEIAGTLLAVIQKEHDGILGVFSSRSIVWGGPLVVDDDPEILDKILKEYNNIIKRKAIYTQFRNLWDWGNAKNVFIENGFEYEDHLDVIFDLNKSEDELLNEMSRNRKKGIKQSYKRGISIKKIDLTDEGMFTKSYDIISDVYNRIKIPMPDLSFFKNAIYELHDKNIILALGAFINGELIGVRIVLCYKNMIYDWYAGAKDEYLKYRPNDVLPWEVMKWGVNNGFDVFEFGGAGKPGVPYGVRDYKLKFGGELVNFGRFEKVYKPLLMELGKIGLNLYRKFK